MPTGTIRKRNWWIKLKDRVSEAAQKAADRMEEIGLIDDEDFARRYAAELFHRKAMPVNGWNTS